MKKIKIVLWALLIGLSALWLLADYALPNPLTFFSVRAWQTQYTGVLAMGVMSVAMVLAVRPKWLEPRLNGLDKMYRLHKWLGIAALIAAITHWLWVQGAKWLVALGWVQRPSRRPPGAGTAADAAFSIEQWLRSQRGLAEGLGEWAFYLAVLLIVLALVKRVPYHWFAKTHTLLAPIYLALVFHSVVLMKFSYWSSPIGWLMALLILAGAVSAIIALFQQIGARRKVTGAIESITEYPELRVLETAVKLAPGWTGHAAGQFAFVTSLKGEGAHPYTIASAWDAATNRIVFITKALGDHTSRLRDTLKVGMQVTVEGPYGCFDFRDDKPRQIWIGAGIGITPFVARMKQLTMVQPNAQIIDLFHTTAEYNALAIEKMTADAQAANVRLHVLIDARDGFLNAARIREAVRQWADASIWFCGPPGFGAALRRDFLSTGIAAENFHQELFQMR